MVMVGALLKCHSLLQAEPIKTIVGMDSGFNARLNLGPSVRHSLCC